MSAAAYMQARDEFTRQLDEIVLSQVKDTLVDLYNKAETIEAFEEVLRDVSKWSDTQISEFVTSVKNRFEQIEELISAIFVATIRVLTEAKASGKSTENIRVQLPPYKVVIHNIFKRCCAIVLRTPDVFTTAHDEYDLDDILSLKFHGVTSDVVRKMLPIQDILRFITRQRNSISLQDSDDNSDDDSSESESSEDDEEKVISDAGDTGEAGEAGDAEDPEDAEDPSDSSDSEENVLNSKSEI